MSYHSKFKDWKYIDPLTDEIIKDIVEGVKYHGYDAYPIYWIGCDADAWIHLIGGNFSNGKINTFKRKIKHIPKEIREKIIIIYKILREDWNKLPNKIRNPKLLKIPDNVELPIIKNMFPELVAKEIVSVQPMKYNPELFNDEDEE